MGEFYKYLFPKLLELPNVRDLSCGRAAMACLEMMLVKRKMNLLVRSAAYVKRMSTLSLESPPNLILGLLHIIRQAISQEPRLRQFLEDETVGEGDFQPDAEDPDTSSPFSSSLWELSLLSHHYHPTVASVAREVALGKELGVEARKRDSAFFFESFDTSKGGFNPPVELPSKHPMEKVLTKLEKVGFFLLEYFFFFTHFVSYEALREEEEEKDRFVDDQRESGDR